MFRYRAKRTDSRDLNRYSYAFTHNSQNVETQTFINRWMKKMWYIHQRVPLSLKEKGNSDTCHNLEDVMLNEISQSQQSEYCMIPLI